MMHFGNGDKPNVLQVSMLIVDVLISFQEGAKFFHLSSSVTLKDNVLFSAFHIAQSYAACHICIQITFLSGRVMLAYGG